MKSGHVQRPLTIRYPVRPSGLGDHDRRAILVQLDAATAHKSDGFSSRPLTAAGSAALAWAAMAAIGISEEEGGHGYTPGRGGRWRSCPGRPHTGRGRGTFKVAYFARMINSLKLGDGQPAGASGAEQWRHVGINRQVAGEPK